jgi:hypothetical protein
MEVVLVTVLDASAPHPEAGESDRLIFRHLKIAIPTLLASGTGTTR